MVDLLNVHRGIDMLKRELVESIKERIDEIGNGTGIQLYPVSVTDASTHSRGLRNTLEIRTIYVNEADVLCGDFGCLNDGNECGVVFGKSMEGLFIEDLYRVLAGLYGKGWQAGGTADCTADEKGIQRMRNGLLRREVWKNKLLRKGA